MMLTGGLMMLWAALLFIGLPLALLATAVALLLRSSARTSDRAENRDQTSK